MVQTILWSFAGIVLIAQLATALLILGILSDFLFKTKLIKSFRKRFAPFTYPFAFLIALSATLGSLFLSEVAQFKPCILCWYQRILMYPQAILLYMAVIRKDNIRPYILNLSMLGLLTAVYHYYIQLFPGLAPCEVAGEVSCIRGYTFYFGYITIPLMSATAFLGIIISMLLSDAKNPKRSK